MTVNNLQDNQSNELITAKVLSNSSLLESIEPLNIDDLAELTTATSSLAEANITEPKRDIMNHLKQSNGNFSYFSRDEQERSSKIREHIQKSLSWEKV